MLYSICFNTQPLHRSDIFVDQANPKKTRSRGTVSKGSVEVSGIQVSVVNRLSCYHDGRLSLPKPPFSSIIPGIDPPGELAADGLQEALLMQPDDLGSKLAFAYGQLIGRGNRLKA